MRKVRKAVIPVAGLGTRFLPATKAVPKEMLTVVDRPVVQHVVDEARQAGIEHFVFVTGRNNVAVYEVPDDQTHQYGICGVDRDMRITHMVEKPAKGTAPSNLAISGRYILQPEIFDLLERQERGAGGEIQITDAMIKLAETQAFH